MQAENTSDAGHGERVAMADSPESLRRELEEERARTLRLLADFANFRRRIGREHDAAAAKERGMHYPRAPRLDNLERALTAESMTRGSTTGLSPSIGSSGGVAGGRCRAARGSGPAVLTQRCTRPWPRRPGMPRKRDSSCVRRAAGGGWTGTSCGRPGWSSPSSRAPDQWRPCRRVDSPDSGGPPPVVC
jgi:hypothetical protein